MDENSIIRKVREYLYQNDVDKIDALEISDSTGIPVNELLEIAPVPEELVRKVFGYELKEFAVIFDEYNFDEQNPIDVLIIVGQEVFKKFHDLNPAITYKLKKLYPEIYEEHLNNKIKFLVDHITNNFKRGKKQGIYKKDLDIENIKTNLKGKIEKLHDHKLLSTGKLTFEYAFNELIEGFIKESAYSDWWSYYKQRKQLYEALDFNR